MNVVLQPRELIESIQVIVLRTTIAAGKEQLQCREVSSSDYWQLPGKYTMPFVPLFPPAYTLDL